MCDFLTHNKATLQKPSDFSFPSLQSVISNQNYREFNVPFEHFKRFIQPVKCADIVQTVILLHEESFRQKALDWMRRHYNADQLSSISLLLSSNDMELRVKIEAYEKKSGLTGKKKFITPTENPWSIQQYYEVVESKGFHIKTVGAQAGGLNQEFYSQYDSSLSSFALKKDFESAYACIDLFGPYDSMEDVEIRKKNFKEYFLDTFEFGVSYLHVEEY